MSLVLEKHDAGVQAFADVFGSRRGTAGGSVQTLPERVELLKKLKDEFYDTAKRHSSQCSYSAASGDEYDERVISCKELAERAYRKLKAINDIQEITPDDFVVAVTYDRFGRKHYSVNLFGFYIGETRVSFTGSNHITRWTVHPHRNLLLRKYDIPTREPKLDPKYILKQPHVADKASDDYIKEGTLWSLWAHIEEIHNCIKTLS